MRYTTKTILVLSSLTLSSLAMAGGKYDSTKSSNTSTQSQQQRVSNNEVKDAQRALNNYGYELNVDGKMGANTKDAIQKFQSDRNLNLTGQLDSATTAALTKTPSDMDEESGRSPASVQEEPEDYEYNDNQDLEPNRMDQENGIEQGFSEDRE